MNKIVSIFKLLLLAGVMFTVASCEDMMSTQSNRYMLAEDNQLLSPNDTVFSVLGILNKVQKLGDKYVLMGEARADLLDITATTNNDLRNLSNHTISPDNPYADTSDFYAVINNCNYFLAHADTNITVRGQKSFLREYHAVKTIRAWTYLQLGLNYGKVRYTEKPILTVDDLKGDGRELNTTQLVDVLIEEIESLNPLNSVGLPGYGTIGMANSRFLFIDPLFLLGDLYLWRAAETHSQQDYEKAATYYGHLIKKGTYSVNHYEVAWYTDINLNRVDGWSLNIFENAESNSEFISIMKLAESSYQGTTSKLSFLSREEEVVVSDNYIELAEEQIYCFREGTESKYGSGDLRMEVLKPNPLISGDFSYDDFESKELRSRYSIMKYRFDNIILYRSALLYLRFAEALNRSGKPSLAFAVLKYGLTDAVLKNASYVNQNELKDAPEYITMFNDELFSGNYGIHSRGSGNSMANIYYVMPTYMVNDTLQNIEGNDSIVPRVDPVLKEASMKFVEDAIVDELALETGLEGNRFHDLMRFSMHKQDDSFLATKVAKKHPSNQAYIQSFLSDRKNWYIPTK